MNDKDPETIFQHLTLSQARNFLLNYGLLDDIEVGYVVKDGKQVKGFFNTKGELTDEVYEKNYLVEKAVLGTFSLIQSTQKSNLEERELLTLTFNSSQNIRTLSDVLKGLQNLKKDSVPKEIYELTQFMITNFYTIT